MMEGEQANNEGYKNHTRFKPEVMDDINSKDR